MSFWVRLNSGSTKRALELNSTWPIRVKEEIILNYKLKYSESFFTFQPLFSIRTPTHSKAPKLTHSPFPSVPYLSRDASAVLVFQSAAIGDRTKETVSRHPDRLRATTFRLSATAHSIYSQLPSILKAVSPSATWGRDIPWSQGHTYHGLCT